MKYLLTALLLTLSMSAMAGGAEKSLRHKVICVEGYKFLVSWSDTGSYRPPSVVQIFERVGTQTKDVPQPMRCDK